MDKLLQMILNRLMGRVISKGINAGIDHVARRGKPASEMSPEERKSAQVARKAGQRAKQAANIARKFMR